MAESEAGGDTQNALPTEIEPRIPHGAQLWLKGRFPSIFQLSLLKIAQNAAIPAFCEFYRKLPKLLADAVRAPSVLEPGIE